MRLDTGIYEIVNKESGKRYVGSTGDSFENRWRQHRSLLRAGNHHSIHLQRAWDKYGEEKFEFRILEEMVAPGFCYHDYITREQWYLDNERCEYNVSSRADRPTGMLGKNHSQETIEKIKQNNLGKKRNEESKKKMSLAKSGKNSPWYGTGGPMKGKKHSVKSKLKVAKLTEQEVLDIRERFPKDSQRKLAEEFDVSRRAIQKILKRETWTHL